MLTDDNHRHRPHQSINDKEVCTNPSLLVRENCQQNFPIKLLLSDLSTTMKPIPHNESSSRSNLSKTTASSCNSPGKSVMSKYTSLREIPPPPPPPPASHVKPRAMHGRESCSRISIRNPLVKQAAMAYLQPMAGRPPGAVVEQGLFRKFKEVCCGGQCGCLEWLHGTSPDEEDDNDLLMRQRTTGGG